MPPRPSIRNRKKMRFANGRPAPVRAKSVFRGWSNGRLPPSFNSQCLVDCIFRALVEDQVEAANQFRGDRSEVGCRRNGQQNPFRSAVEAHLKRIRQRVERRPCERPIGTRRGRGKRPPDACERRASPASLARPLPSASGAGKPTNRRSRTVRNMLTTSCQNDLETSCTTWAAIRHRVSARQRRPGTAAVEDDSPMRSASLIFAHSFGVSLADDTMSVYSGS